MLARQYNRLIKIMLKTTIPDGYGGNIPGPDLLIKSVYAKVKTSAGNKFVQYGIQDFKNPLLFSVRGIKNKIVFTENHFIEYQGKQFFVKGVEDKNLDGMEFNILCDEG